MSLTPEQLGQAIVGLGLALFAAHNSWTTIQARREARAAAGEAKTAAGNTEQVRATLTTNNGGSHVKDSLDRIESRQTMQGDQLADLSTNLRDHVTVSGRTEAHIFERLDRLERRRSRFPFL